VWPWRTFSNVRPAAGKLRQGRDGNPGKVRIGGSLHSIALMGFATTIGAWALASSPSGPAATPGGERAPPQLTQDTLFRHDDHQSFDCVRCHSSGSEHGGLLVPGLEGCRSCHHTLPVAATCTGCHNEVSDSQQLFAVLQTLKLSQGKTATRTLPFQHIRHEDAACASCHGSPPLSAQVVDCAGCHADHHSEGTDCATCHVQAPEAVHPLTVHAGCTGAACHDSRTFAGAFQTRSFCLACHQDQAEHRESEDCATCHVMPPPNSPGLVGLATPGRQR
jgi:hypothetical protein